ncbi:MAG: hypothetical protein IJ404_01340 [Clostridia bacterium]|nr:hypothetical protein [Clostridia bacterium]MBQ8893235.1 hypothetical protein [Clostridia bacterium]
MNIIWYVSICLLFLSTALAFSLMAENKRLKKQQKEQEEQVIIRRFRSLQA